MNIYRRIFLYIVSLISLGILAYGAQTLLFLGLDAAFSVNSIYFPSQTVQQRISLGLAMIIIGGPLWFFFWRNIQRQVDSRSPEIGSAIRQGYLNLILAVTALIALYSAASFLKWLIAGIPGFNNASGSLATLIVSALIWYYHWRISETEGQPSPAAKTLRRWHIYIISGWGLTWLAVGIVELVYSVTLYYSASSDTQIRQIQIDNFRNYIPWIILGGLWWYFYWFRMSKGDIESALRRVYIYLLAIVGGSIASLVAVIFMLHHLFLFALGASVNTAGHYFTFLGWTFPLTIVATAIVAYHQNIAQKESVQTPERHLSARRIHLYILSFLGLGVSVAGIAILTGMLLNIAANNFNPPTFIQLDWWKTQLAEGLALLLVGIPVWSYFWHKVISLVGKGNAVEWTARSRRTYLYGIIGVSIIALAADLVNIAYQILNGTLTGNFGMNVLRNSIWSIQSLIIAAPILAYHWQVFRNDQLRGAEVASNVKMVTVVADDSALAFINSLENNLGNKIRVLQISGPSEESPSFSDAEITNLVSQIQTSPSPKVMVILREGKAIVLPYQEK